MLVFKPPPKIFFFHVLFPGECRLIQDSYPTAKITEKLFDEYRNNLRYPAWTPQSPDMSNVEYLWGHLCVRFFPSTVLSKQRPLALNEE
ncbi:hypothetical protein HNY73_015870 [Argiope bruennichi]|uniref:Uncharacterized protein n=1 Tax=Argiope bruennichi TaxID=94029 RepID=A0A8T0EHD0_ARGBR|nr:hypothetical protein HNY73_015870 [Argiope bruennichi]